MKKQLIRIALTQTVNAYKEMPVSLSKLKTLQDNFEEVRKTNIDHNIVLIAWAYRHHADIICLGELFSFPYFPLTRDSFWLQTAEDAKGGPTIKKIRIASKKYSLTVIVPIFEKDNGKYYDTAVIIDKGVLLGKYRKTHIPNGINEQGSFYEKYYFRPGVSKKLIVFHTDKLTFGVIICYDRHFPEMSRFLARRGAQVIFCPSVSFGEVAERLWEHEAITESGRNEVFFAISNRMGKEKPWNIRYFGKSLIASPDGILVKNKSSHSEIILADIDLTILSKKNTGWNLLKKQ